MRALTMTGAAPDGGATIVTEVAEPQPRVGEVAIEVAFAGINFIDVMARRGDPGYASQWPYVPGLEVSGTISGVGDGVDPGRVGQRVAAFTPGGGLAEVAVAPDHAAVGVPDGVSSDRAAAAPLVLSTALLLLTDVARLHPGETLMMHSASGGLGAAVAQVARRIGVAVTIGTVGAVGKVSAARDADWDVALTRDGELARRVLEHAVGGVDVVLDPSGTALLELDLGVAAPGARIVLFGNPGGGTPAPLPSLGRLIGANVSVGGFSMSALARTAPQRPVRALERVLTMVGAGELDPAPTVVDSLKAVAGVHDLLAAGRGRGKYVTRVAA